MSSRRPGLSFVNVISHLGVMVGVAALMGALVAGLAIPFAAVAGLGARNVADTMDELPTKRREVPPLRNGFGWAMLLAIAAIAFVIRLHYLGSR